MERRKPKLLIIGHARHGKDTFAELVATAMNLSFISSSEFVGRECVWNAWGEERYETFEDMFEDRVNFRSTWANLILAYNTPDRSRTATEMLRDRDIYVGMRNKKEFDACIDKKLFDYVIWVDGIQRHPPEGKDSNQMTRDMADMLIDNNGPEENMHMAVFNLQKRLHEEGYEVNYVPLPEHAITPPNEPEVDDPLPLEWADAPEGTTPVLDYGFFKVLEVMGSDKTICESARMSYGRGTKRLNNDEGLINYLVRHHHTSPLEMGEIRMHIRMPIFVMRQWVRHRTANLNEYSGRYSEMVRLFYVPEPDQICLQDKVNKQGSAEPIGEPKVFNARGIIENISNDAFDEYEKLLRMGVSRETARIILPLNTYTEVVWKLDVSNLLKFLWLRDDSHAQWEIRQYALHVAAAVKEHFPLVYAAYERTRASTTLTDRQITALITGDDEGLPKNEIAELDHFRDRVINQN
jgi:thymidylate synthase (FAD)